MCWKEWGGKFAWAMGNTMADVKEKERKKERIKLLLSVLDFGKAKAFFFKQLSFLRSCLGQSKP